MKIEKHMFVDSTQLDTAQMEQFISDALDSGHKETEITEYGKRYVYVGNIGILDSTNAIPCKVFSSDEKDDVTEYYKQIKKGDVIHKTVLQHIETGRFVDFIRNQEIFYTDSVENAHNLDEQIPERYYPLKLLLETKPVKATITVELEDLRSKSEEEELFAHIPEGTTHIYGGFTGKAVGEEFEKHEGDMVYDWNPDTESWEMHCSKARVVISDRITVEEYKRRLKEQKERQ